MTPQKRFSGSGGSDATVAVELPGLTDGYGYACVAAHDRPYQAGDRQLALTGDNNSERVDPPFPVPLYGRTYRQARISTNGVVHFGGPERRLPRRQ
ncbi:hypothetical protein [Streptomyces sp. NPDC048269]|uniref:hypothetical protein n=1 Tax=Streptomyces sp. NPDC048269 TaxID=3155753 RepID=UPI003428F16D